MKKKKIELEQFNIKSFITNLEEKQKQTINGMGNVDTSFIQHCSPHGSIQTCPSEYNCGPIDRLTFNTVRRTIWSFCYCTITV